MKKVVIELDRKLMDGELLIYKGDKLCGVTLGELLPEYENALNKIHTLEEEIENLKQQVRELRGEDDEEISEDNN